MAIEYFDHDADNETITAALRRDGAVILTEQVSAEVADTVHGVVLLI